MGKELVSQRKPPAEEDQLALPAADEPPEKRGHAAYTVTRRKTRTAAVHDSLVIKLCVGQGTLKDCL